MSLPLAMSVQRKNKLKPKEALQGSANREEAMEDMAPEEPKRSVMVSMENKPAQMMSKGGMIDHKAMAERILAKRMASGGDVAHYEEGGDVDDFLSDEESSEGPFGEGEHLEDREDMGMHRKDVLAKIFSRLSSRG